jgi:FlgD Ig-like domain
MFPCVKSKVAVIVGMILTMATLSAGQGFHLEWELDSLVFSPSLPSYLPTFGAATATSDGNLYPYNVGGEYNLENDGVSDIIIPEQTSDIRLKDLKIYDCATRSLKYTVNFQNYSKTFQLGAIYGFFDIDNDGTKELVFIPTEGYMNSILFINVQTSAIKYEFDSVRLCGVYDLDHDAHPEFWCTKGDRFNYSLQIWGSGSTMAKSISPALMKQNLAKLIGNSPNPFVASTRIEYYVPEKQNVQLQIFSSDGKFLRNLVDGPQKMGEYSALWDGKTNNGQMMAVGSYYYRLKVGDFISSKKMVELK